MKVVSFHADAEAEMRSAAAYYARRHSPLGRRFLAAVQDATNRVASQPQLFPFVEHDVQRCLTRDFPYAILFRVQSDYIEIIAVMHQHRDPDYWHERID